MPIGFIIILEKYFLIIYSITDRFPLALLEFALKMDSHVLKAGSPFQDIFAF